MDAGTIKGTTGTSLRKGRSTDAKALGTICYEAFEDISKEHNFPKDFPDPETATEFMSMLLGRPDVYSVIAESGGNVVGSNFLWEGDAVAGVGPITVDPSAQNSAIGRALMKDVLKRADKNRVPSVRLVQAAYHSRSLSLYTKLGFDTVEPLSNIQGPRLGIGVEGYRVRKMTVADIEGADKLAFLVHGHTRHNEVASAVQLGTAKVVEHDGRITGYSTSVGFFGHTVGQSNSEIMALIGAADEFAGPGFLLPTRNSELLRWCLANGLKVVQPMTLMSRGLYQEPRGAFLPSILY